MAETNIRKSQMRYIPIDLLNDLSSRFIINVPEEERTDLTRVCFQIELAHWFYVDFYREKDSKLPKCSLKEFIHVIFQHIPFLQKYYEVIDSVITNWMEYKRNVPTYGAIILNENLSDVLLVQSYASNSSWGFPKGKVNEEEKPRLCAIREVFEETGFDISDLINSDVFLEHCYNGQLTRLYIVTGVSQSTKFQTRTRKEIKSIQWFPVSGLPNYRGIGASSRPRSFFTIIPFMKQLQKWISKNIHKSSENSLPSQQHLLSKKESVLLNSSREVTYCDVHKVLSTDFLVPSSVWKNFSLDCKTLVAVFNSHLRETVPLSEKALLTT